LGSRGGARPTRLTCLRRRRSTRSATTPHSAEPPGLNGRERGQLRAAATGYRPALDQDAAGLPVRAGTSLRARPGRSSLRLPTTPTPLDGKEKVRGPGPDLPASG